MAIRNADVPVASGYIPKLYSAKLLKDFYEKSILPSITNTDYQGEFSQKGDEIIIPRNVTIPVKPWKDGDQVVYDEPVAETVKMKIDMAGIWAFKVSKLTEKQTHVKTFKSAWIEDASEQMQKFTETLCLGRLLNDTLAEGNYGLKAGVDSGMYNLGTLEQPVTITQSVTGSDVQNATDYVCDVMSVLGEQNVTSNGEAVSFVCPKVYVNRLSKSEFRRADVVGNSQTTLKMGQSAIGQVMGANVYASNYMRPVKNTSGKTVFPIIACTKRAASFALQFTETKVFSDLEHEVASAHRGVAVFGCKLIEPKAFAVGYVTFA